MIVTICVGMAMMIACLAVQIAAVVQVIRYYVAAARQPLGEHPLLSAFRQLVYIMLLLLVAGIVQMAGWAALYQILGQFPDFETALYFSGVTFTSLGYGDFTLTGRARMLAPMEASDGLMMFGVTSAVFMIALQHAINRSLGLPTRKQ
ncbi:potassium channel family protein [Agrilutibacter solisilvae]|uniref:Two pore domain potassium channel family protein n=1 Tax=Agrilutibacter solisilvae TaxID=2763317 RepID=A0A974Y1F6_9GAMM|nr:potassium channel family protein [Lysobacter solisilvae]QSX78783.1 two pore domain potassium channel family protein [Lysobacter solisilvae]